MGARYRGRTMGVLATVQPTVLSVALIVGGCRMWPSTSPAKATADRTCSDADRHRTDMQQKVQKGFRDTYTGMVQIKEDDPVLSQHTREEIERAKRFVEECSLKTNRYHRSGELTHRVFVKDERLIVESVYGTVHGDIQCCWHFFHKRPDGKCASDGFCGSSIPAPLPEDHHEGGTPQPTLSPGRPLVIQGIFTNAPPDITNLVCIAETRLTGDREGMNLARLDGGRVRFGGEIPSKKGRASRFNSILEVATNDIVTVRLDPDAVKILKLEGAATNGTVIHVYDEASGEKEK